MENKVDQVLEHIIEIKADLREHMLRTEQNEKMISMLAQKTDPMHMAFVGIKWSIGAVVTLVSLLGAFYKLLGK